MICVKERSGSGSMVFCMGWRSCFL